MGRQASHATSEGKKKKKRAGSVRVDEWLPHELQ